MSDSSSTSRKSVRHCPNCRVRMSSLDLDPHRICVACRGINCSMDERCDLCLTWDEGRMQSYIRHQSSLKRKREHKQKLKERSQVPDFVSVCTGIQEADALSDEARSRDGGFDDFHSSVAGSASMHDVGRVVREEVASLGNELEARLSTQIASNVTSTVTSSLDKKLDIFSSNMLVMLEELGVNVGMNITFLLNLMIVLFQLPRRLRDNGLIGDSLPHFPIAQMILKIRAVRNVGRTLLRI